MSLYRTKKEILERLAKYEELKRDMVNRHSKTNMKRMQTLAELGKDSDGMERGGSNWEDDDFGKNDEDWEIYREVNMNKKLLKIMTIIRNLIKNQKLTKYKFEKK